jgi:hypothetical protein
VQTGHQASGLQRAQGIAQRGVGNAPLDAEPTACRSRQRLRDPLRIGQAAGSGSHGGEHGDQQCWQRPALAALVATVRNLVQVGLIEASGEHASQTACHSSIRHPRTSLQRRQGSAMLRRPCGAAWCGLPRVVSIGRSRSHLEAERKAHESDGDPVALGVSCRCRGSRYRRDRGGNRLALGLGGSCAAAPRFHE